MNVDRILTALNEAGVEYLLVGGMNFLLRHEPVLTYDVDVWVQPAPENLRRTEKALIALDAEWGETEENWRPVGDRDSGWLGKQALYCLTSPHGAIDVFLVILGLGAWEDSRRVAVSGATASGIPYRGLSDADMLRCQEALDENDRKEDRIRVLRGAIQQDSDEDRPETS